ncbi:MAG TPA: hypothetical protein PK825_06310 [Bacteroidales bacterium]|nr:hypothetical protein [Bacteroidales bacterium]
MNGRPLLPPGCNPGCPACTHREMPAQESLKQKEDFIKKTLSPWKDVVQPVTGPEEQKRLGYRNKVILHARYQEKRWMFGMIKRNEFVPVMECPVHAAGVNQVLLFLSQALPPPEEFPLAYYVQAGKQATLILKGKKLVKPEWIDGEAEKVFAFNSIDGLWIHCNPSAGRRLFEKTPMECVWGSPWSFDERNMQYGPRSFQQLIPGLYHASLREAFSWMRPDPDFAVIDLYSGTGNSLRYWTEAGSPTLGIELAGEAVTCARKNVPEAEVLRGKCSERIPQVEAWAEAQRTSGKKILLYANPPRTGIEPPVQDSITTTLRPSRIAYLSCSPGTLSKNLKILCERGYTVRRIVPFDFFPLTKHVECLALLDKI